MTPEPMSLSQASIESSDDDSDSLSSSLTSSDALPSFRFNELPPEIRHQIWRAVVPSAGINFFNVHCFPNDHPGTNRSTSPPRLYLDLRRLDIGDDDETVSQYDPSAWQSRSILSRTCHEARTLCAIPESKVAIITVTRPRRGLFIRAGDGQLRKLTPLNDPRIKLSYSELSHEQELVKPEPQISRKIQVHADDILCLSLENCSFNLPNAEHPLMRDDLDDSRYLTYDYDNDEDMGWVFDPILKPCLPSVIPIDRYCVSMARSSRPTLSSVRDVVAGLLYMWAPSTQWEEKQELLLIMFDAATQEPGERGLDELTPAGEVFWDRFGDCYVPLPWDSTLLRAKYRLTKVWPETNDIRDRYLRSALLQSPKRPASSF
ncbi:Uu.00g055660.m01.CDS01 [Anthostomella pinea]|uniref:Uu.00g055660.m01.CDS01 n=1 Tax=Anthostomella pinea TaxID=933095 RepID=A0AAI8VR50_9PEZI|nr:Uu.00g055660.m01.CDS01 [Anthostomella pinea]